MTATARPILPAFRRLSSGGHSRTSAAAITIRAVHVLPAASYSGQGRQRPLASCCAPSTSAPFLRAPLSTASPAPSSAAEPSVPASSSDPNSAVQPPPIVWTTDRLTPEQVLKVDRLFHRVLWLDMIETAILVDVMNARLGRVSMTERQKAALERYMGSFGSGDDGASAASQASAPKEEEAAAPKLVDLKLVGFDDKQKIKVIKEVRSILGLGLKEAKELVEGAPKVLSKQIKPEQADELRERLVAAGAQVEVS